MPACLSDRHTLRIRELGLDGPGTRTQRYHCVSKADGAAPRIKKVKTKTHHTPWEISHYLGLWLPGGRLVLPLFRSRRPLQNPRRLVVVRNKCEWCAHTKGTNEHEDKALSVRWRPTATRTCQPKTKRPKIHPPLRLSPRPPVSSASESSRASPPPNSPSSVVTGDGLDQRGGVHKKNSSDRSKNHIKQKDAAIV